MNANNLDLDAIEARANGAGDEPWIVVHEPAWEADGVQHPDLSSVTPSSSPMPAPTVPALVAALREARAEVDRLRETMALAESVFMAEARASGQYEAERDDWRRRYEALRDGVTGLHFRDARGGCASCIDPDSFSVRWPCETAAVVARVEGDES